MFIQLGRAHHVGYEQRAPDECWPWYASLDSNGYGQCFNRRSGKVDKAHSVVYEYATGQLAPRRGSGMELHHTCHNRACVNPAHLRVVTLTVNRLLRREAPHKPWTHGKPGTYTRGCRCNECRASWRDYWQTRRAKQAKRPKAGKRTRV